MIQVIFVPVLFVCMNHNCEFMQAQNWYKSEQQCRAAVDAQKENLQKIGEDKMEMEVLEAHLMELIILDMLEQMDKQYHIIRDLNIVR